MCMYLTHTQKLYPKDWIGFYRCFLKIDAITVPYLWGHLGKHKGNTNEILLEPLMIPSSKIIYDSKFSRNSKTQPSSGLSERSKTINTAPQLPILSWIGAVLAQVSHVRVRNSILYVAWTEEPFQLWKTSFYTYLYLYAYISSYLTYDGIWQNTKITQMRFSLIHWSELVLNFLLISLQAIARHSNLKINYIAYGIFSSEP